MGSAGTTKALGQKHELDKFYTKRDVAATCLARLDLGTFSRIIEPSAGAGAFSDALLSAQPGKVLALDLAPESATVTEQDWFTFTTLAPGRTLVVGNPPFGVQCNLAIRFINHAFLAVGADTVAFVLPRSFRKASIQKRLFPFAELTDELILGRNSFELEGADYDLRAVFQVWKRTTVARIAPVLPLTSSLFTFTGQSEPHHFAIRRVGGRAGHAHRDTPATSRQSNYFVRLDVDLPVDAVIASINASDFSVADDGTGPRTLSKGELVAIADAAISALVSQQAEAA